MTILKLAFDRTARRIDEDGRLHVDRSHISKAAVNPYYGEEIPGWQQLGLDAKKVYKMLRDPVELERAIETFARLPILSKHVPVTVDILADNPNLKQIIVGSTGSQVTYDAPYVDSDLTFWDATSIAGIESGQVKELSCAYRYVPVMESGEFEGVAYDGRMTEIRGNHLALVPVGRAGSDVVVADHNPFKEVPAMKMTKLGKALFAALCAASPVLAADSALPSLVGNASSKTVDPRNLKALLLAKDADLDPQQLDNVIDALLDVEQDPRPMETPQAAADATPADKIRSMLAGKVEDAVIDEIVNLIAAPAADEACDPAMKKEDVEAAMDSLRKELREAAEACRDVRPVVGDVMGMDSAEDVYAFALKQMGVDCEGVRGAPALRALFKVASANKPAERKPSMAQDAANVAMVPGLDRFRHA